MNTGGQLKEPSDRLVACRAEGGFSLVEVVLAIGVVAFALIAVISLFSVLMQSSKENSKRRELAEAVDSLRAYLNDEAGFAQSFTLATSGANLLYVTYRVDLNGLPDANGETVTGRWTNPADPELSLLESARSGRWLNAKLSISPSNPGGIATGAPASYPCATLFVLAEIEATSLPGQPIPGEPRLQSTIAVLR